VLTAISIIFNIIDVIAETAISSRNKERWTILITHQVNVVVNLLCMICCFSYWKKILLPGFSAAESEGDQEEGEMNRAQLWSWIFCMSGFLDWISGIVNTRWKNITQRNCWNNYDLDPRPRPGQNTSRKSLWCNLPDYLKALYSSNIMCIVLHFILLYSSLAASRNVIKYHKYTRASLKKLKRLALGHRIT